MSQDTEAGTGAQPAPAQQPEALRLAEFLEARQTHLGSWRGSCDEYDRQDWDDYIKAWELLRSQHARIAELEALPAQACLHRIADMRNANVASGFMCVDCGAIFAAAPALQAAPPAPAAVAVPEGFALVPKRLTRAMEMVLCADEEGWQWEDLLAAAEAITEEEHAALAAAPAQASPSECDSPELCRVHRGCAGQYGTKNTCPSFAVLNPCNPAAPAQEHATQLAAQGQRQGVWLKPAREGRVYVAGPMTGLPEFNFPAFHAKAAELRAGGWLVENPADHGHVDGAEWADYLHYDIGRMATCCAIHLLPGWSRSRGAALEVHIASALGLEFQYAEGAERAAPAQAQEDATIVWPKSRDVGRIGDMSTTASLRVGLDGDNDSYVNVWDENGGGSIEFCTPGAGGGKSRRTRVALLALMVAMEADNAEDPRRDWWAARAALGGAA